MGSRGEQAPSSTNYLKERIGQREGLMIREKLPNFLLVYTSKKGNPTSHYWPKKSEQDVVGGDFFMIRPVSFQTIVLWSVKRGLLTGDLRTGKSN